MVDNNISAAMKHFNDYNKKNYIITHIDNTNRPFKFDEELYDMNIILKIQLCKR
jgi:phosphoribosyl 1,2-cyclic phosphodiesterase